MISKKLLKSISFSLGLAIFISVFPQKAFADSWLSDDSANPESCTTNYESKTIGLPMLDVDCYVLYTSRESDEPSQDQMWRIPAGSGNFQDFNIPGTWYLHVYVPSTGQRITYGPYQKDAQAPKVPTITPRNVIVGQYVNVPEGYLSISSNGDIGDTGHDNINYCDSYWMAGFKKLEIWDTLDGVDYKIEDVTDYQEVYELTIKEQGWHKIWARACDNVDNYSEYAICEFGLGEPTTEPLPVSSVGGIKFDPNATKWTNKGKTGEGEGSYPIKVYYDGDNPFKAKGKATIEKEVKDSEGKTKTKKTTKNFDVNFPLKSIEVSGDAEGTIDGASGVVNIEKEGGNQKLHAEGTWGDAEYSEPDGATSIDLPSTPASPVNDSGEYFIDWTKPQYTVDEPKREWHNDNPTYDVDVKIHDELSGIKGGKITVNDSSHYAHDSTVSIAGGRAGTKDISKTINLDDGIYSMNVNTTDVATNENNTTYETYYEDHTKPVVSFSMDGKQIFSEENGAIRKSSILGKDDSFYGVLTASDNLSGMKSISYKWTYGDNGDIYPDNDYTSIYSKEDTYSDRYQEVINKEIEKPVGDDLYLHIKEYDEAGNYTYACYGPYEDPIKLTNFEVTDIRDPRWTNVFWNDDSYKDYKNFSFKANQLPVDEESHPTLRNALPKKGYAFYWDITSEYIYRQNDRIEITPTFYYLQGTNRIRADAYYNNDNNPLVKFGTEQDDSKLYLNTNTYGNVLIGNYNKLILTRGVRICKGREWIDKDEVSGNGWKDEIQYSDGKIQWWYGKYYIPASTFFVKSGDKPLPQNKLTGGGDILINFEIIGYKNGVETFSSSQIFNYTQKQWSIEGGPKSNALDYKVGDTIVYNAKYGTNSDKGIAVIH